MPLPCFPINVLEAICDVLGDTSRGLTGAQIGNLLGRLHIADDSLDGTKRRRLLHALRQRQEADRVGNLVGAFIENALDPVRFSSDTQRFESLRGDLNQALAFAGLALGEDGRLRHVQTARTLTEAQRRAARLRHELERRCVHPDVLRFCQEELLSDNFFHAVFEATKSVADKIRTKSGLASDGAELVDQAFSAGRTTPYPILALNSLQTPTEQGEQKGFVNLLKGLFGTFRNVTAHAPKIHWSITEQDALDLMTLSSLLHRRIDNAVRTSVSP